MIEIGQYPFIDSFLGNIGNQVLSSGVFLGTQSPEYTKDTKKERDAVYKYLVPRIGLFNSIYELFSDSKLDKELPFSYVTSNQAMLNELVAGYSPKSTIPTDIMTNYFLNMSQHLQQGSSNFNRCIKCLLWVHKNHGFEEALSYFINSIKSGLFPSLLDTSKALLFYFKVLELGESTFDKLLNNVDFENSKRWIEKEIFYTELIPEGNITLNTDDIGEELEFFIGLLLEECEEARKTKSYDSWLIHQYFLYKVLRGAYNIFKSLNPRPGLAAEAIFSKLEEIMADSGAIVRMIESYREIRSNIGLNYALFTVPTIFNGKHDRSRLFEDRAVTPYQLSDFKGWDTTLPIEWKYLDLNNAIALSICGFMSSDQTLLCTRSIEKEEIFSFEQILNLHERNLIEIGNLSPSAKKNRLIQLSSEYPYVFQYHWELSISYDLDGQYSNAESQILKALTLNPFEPLIWQSASVIVKNQKRTKESKLITIIKDLISDKSKGQKNV